MFQNQIKISFPDIFRLISRTSFILFDENVDKHPGKIVSRNNINKLMFYAIIVAFFFCFFVVESSFVRKNKAINTHTLCETILHLFVNLS